MLLGLLYGTLEALDHDPRPWSEALPDAHPEVQAFIGRADTGFSRLDADFVRVLEDVIDTLISRHIIAITDLPAEAQSKLLSRKSYRERRNAQALSLFDDEGVIRAP